MSRVRKPSPALSTTDKNLLCLLSKIIIENLDGVGANRGNENVVLSDAQAHELLHLLSELMQSESFLRKLTFVNLIVDTPPGDTKLDLRLVRLTGKRSIGAGIGMTSETMRKWRVRLGVSPPKRANDPSPMTFTHFLKMEEKLLGELDVDPRVAQLVLRIAERNEPALRALVCAINGELSDPAKSRRVLRLGDLRQKFTTLISDPHMRELPTNSVVGLFTVISDTSILFTTRDWGVAGTMSTICGGMSMIGADRR